MMGRASTRLLSGGMTKGDAVPATLDGDCLHTPIRQAKQSEPALPYDGGEGRAAPCAKHAKRSSRAKRPIMIPLRVRAEAALERRLASARAAG